MHITAIKQQVKQPDRYSVFVDGKFAFGVSAGALLELRLAEGQELTGEELSSLKKASADDKAYGNALRYAVMRPRSVWEMEFYLKRKAIDEDTAKHILERLFAGGFLDDVAFARAWIANRRLLKSSSQRKLKLELRQKHVPEPIIGQVLAEDEADEREVLRELVAKRRSRYADTTKLMQYLARQGFSYEDIKAVLEERPD